MTTRTTWVAVAMVLGLAGGQVALAQGPPGGPGSNDPNRWFKLPDPGPGDKFTPILAKLKLERKQVAKFRPFLMRANGERAGQLKNAKKVKEIDDQVYRMSVIVLTTEQKPKFDAALRKAGYVPPAARP